MARDATERLEALRQVSLLSARLVDEVAIPLSWADAVGRSLPVHGRLSSAEAAAITSRLGVVSADVSLFTGPSRRVFHVGDVFDAVLYDDGRQARVGLLTLVAVTLGPGETHDRIDRGRATRCVFRPGDDVAHNWLLRLPPVAWPAQRPLGYLTSTHDARRLRAGA